VIPLRDSPRSSTVPVVTWLLIAVNVLVFVFELQLGHRRLDGFVEVFGFVPRTFFRWTELGGAPLDPWRFVPLVTATFLHGGFLHIVGNMWFLGIFGDNVEDRLGHGRYLLFYLLCGVGSMVVQGAFTPGSTVPAIGASGAIAGVLGAYLLLYPGARVLTLIILVIIPWFVELPAVVFLGVWFLAQLLAGTAALSPMAGAAAGGVAWWAHAGGFVLGIALCLLLRKPPRLRTQRDWTTRAPRGIWLPR
jgi:membrane associated rhomboid family serine protease